MPDERPSEGADVVAAQEPATVSLRGEPPILSLDSVAEREGLSVADQIALQDADLRQWMARRVVIVFIIANVATLLVIAGLVWLDQTNIASKLTSPNQRIISQEVILGLLGATTVQVGTIAVIIARYLFPSRTPQA